MIYRELIEKHATAKQINPMGITIALLEAIGQSAQLTTTHAAIRGSSAPAFGADVLSLFPMAKKMGYQLELPKTVLEAVDMLLFCQYQMAAMNYKAARDHGREPDATDAEARMKCTETASLLIREMLNNVGNRAMAGAIGFQKMAKEQGWILDPPPDGEKPAGQ